MNQFMENYYTFFKKKSLYLNSFVLILLFWSSINTGSKYIIQSYSSETEIINFVNLLRSVFPYLIIFYLIFFLKYNPLQQKKLDIVFILLILYSFFQLTGLIYNFHNLHEHYWIICLLSVIFFFNYLVQIKNSNVCNVVFILNKIAVFFLFIVFSFFIIKENILSSGLLYHSNAFDMLLFKEQIPRASGISRMGIILFIFFNFLYFSKYFSNRLKICVLLANILVVSIILLIQSRGAIITLLPIILLLNYLIKFQDKIERIKYNFFIIIIPVIIFLIYPNLKDGLISVYGENKILKKHNNIVLDNSKLKVIVRENFVPIYDNKSIKQNLISFSNNRILAWDFLVQKFFKNNINENLINILIDKGYNISSFNEVKRKNYVTGFGPQADRFLMYNNTKKGSSDVILGPFGFHASNGYVYSLICSGILGLITIISLNLVIIYRISKIIRKFKLQKFNDEPILGTAIIIIFFFQLRFFFENSYSVFGVDLLIFMSSYLVILNNYLNKTKSKN